MWFYKYILQLQEPLLYKFANSKRFRNKETTEFN